jgi:hypothetical protein
VKLELVGTAKLGVVLQASPTTLQPKLILIVEDYGLKASIRKTSRNKGRAISDPAFAFLEYFIF